MSTSQLEIEGRSSSRHLVRARARLCRWSAAIYVLAGCGSAAVVSYGAVRLPAVHTNHDFGHTGIPFIDGWLHWDAGWYLEIARHGYSYAPNRQSSVAFFPLYPLAMRAVGAVVGGPLAAGMILTVASGATASVLFAAWLAARFDEVTVRAGVVLFVLGPYSFYLFGAVYSDAMFAAAALAAFVLLERRRPVLAGLTGAIATACRPVGIIVVIALALRTRELRADAPGRSLSRAAPALATLGLAAYAAYLYQRFGNPIAFITTQSQWGHSLNGSTLLKVPLLHELAHIRTPYDVVRYALAPTVTLIAFALVPRVFRRLGAAYGWYALLIIALPALTTGDLFSMGRFLLPAFPCIAVAAELLAGRRRLRFAMLTLTALTGVVVTMLLAQGNYLA